MIWIYMVEIWTGMDCCFGRGRIRGCNYTGMSVASGMVESV